MNAKRLSDELDDLARAGFAGRGESVAFMHEVELFLGSVSIISRTDDFYGVFPSFLVAIDMELAVSSFAQFPLISQTVQHRPAVFRFLNFRERIAECHGTCISVALAAYLPAQTFKFHQLSMQPKGFQRVTVGMLVDLVDIAGLSIEPCTVEQDRNRVAVVGMDETLFLFEVVHFGLAQELEGLSRQRASFGSAPREPVPQARSLGAPIKLYRSILQFSALDLEVINTFSFSAATQI